MSEGDFDPVKQALPQLELRGVGMRAAQPQAAAVGAPFWALHTGMQSSRTVSSVMRPDVLAVVDRELGRIQKGDATSVRLSRPIRFVE